MGLKVVAKSGEMVSTVYWSFFTRPIPQHSLLIVHTVYHFKSFLHFLLKFFKMNNMEFVAEMDSPRFHQETATLPSLVDLINRFVLVIASNATVPFGAFIHNHLTDRTWILCINSQLLSKTNSKIFKSWKFEMKTRKIS
jgi:hypothetical protein